MRFSYEIDSTPQEQIVQLFGYINEETNFDHMKIPSGPRLVLDLKGIMGLNSIGLRNWVKWVRNLIQYPNGIYLRHCPNVVVQQINVLEGFLPLGAVIESLDVPFYCDSCGNDFSYEAQRGRDFMEATDSKSEAITMPMTLPCKTCGKEAHADILPQKYFSFLARTK